MTFLTMYRYAIFGSGQWGVKVYNFLKSKNRQVFFFPSLHIKKSESIDQYKCRILRIIKLSKDNFDILWIAVKPGNYQAAIIECGLLLDKHIICEKPLYIKKSKILYLKKLSYIKNLKVFINFEFCFLNHLNKLSEDFNRKKNKFYGIFNTSKPNRLKIEPFQNLGLHILAIYKVFFYKTTLLKIDCDYNCADNRSFTLECADTAKVLNFTKTKENLLLKFINNFEKAIVGKKHLTLDLDFYDNLT